MAQPRLPSQLTYNDLNGAEALDILCDHFRHLLQSHPQFQQHLTLPMARITLDIGVGIDMYIGGTVPVASEPERLFIPGTLEIKNEVKSQSQGQGKRPVGPSTRESDVPARVESLLSTIVNAAPIPGGEPPDAHRERHALPIPQPHYEPRDRDGRQLFPYPSDTGSTESFRQTPVAPVPEVHDPTLMVPDRQGVPAEGYIFSTEAINHTLTEQTIPLDKRGKIAIDLSGDGKMVQGGNVVKTGITHYSSVKTLGDEGGREYGSVSGTYDAGPAGLGRPGRGGGGLYSDGRARISFGNQHKG